MGHQVVAEYGSGHPSGLISHEIAGSNPASATSFNCPDGGMVDTLVLEASAERRVSSSLTWGTK